jgi:hypothetical protein
VDFPLNPCAKLPHCGRLSLFVFQDGSGVPVLREAFLQSPALVIRLQSGDFKRMSNCQLVLIERLPRFGNELNQAQPSVLCCAPDYVADESDSRTWAGTESRRTKHKQIADKRKEKPRDDNVDMQNCTTLLQGLTVGIRNLAEYAKALSIKLIHSSRSRIAGSIDSARCAGIQVATRPSNVIARTTPVNTRGSRGVA